MVQQLGNQKSNVIVISLTIGTIICVPIKGVDEQINHKAPSNQTNRVFMPLRYCERGLAKTKKGVVRLQNSQKLARKLQKEFQKDYIKKSKQSESQLEGNKKDEENIPELLTLRFLFGGEECEAPLKASADIGD